MTFEQLGWLLVAALTGGRTNAETCRECLGSGYVMHRQTITHEVLAFPCLHCEAGERRLKERRDQQIERKP